MSDAHGVARDQLRAFIERIERLEEEKKTIADDIKDVYGEAKSMGFDTKILRKVISIRKIDADVRAEQEAMLDTYLQALGMIQMDMFEEPETSPKLVATVATAMQTQAGRAALLTAVDIMIEREERQEPDGGAIAPVKGETRLANAAGVEPPPSERFDPTTGEIPDDAPRAEIGLDIVTRHTEIASTSQGDAVVPSAEVETSGANEGGEDVESSATRAGLEGGPVNLEPSGPEAERATSFLTKPPTPLRPHCQRPEMCAGVGRTHCHTCAKAMREREPAEELA